MPSPRAFNLYSWRDQIGVRYPGTREWILGARLRQLVEHRLAHGAVAGTLLTLNATLEKTRGGKRFADEGVGLADLLACLDLPEGHYASAGASPLLAPCFSASWHPLEFSELVGVQLLRRWSFSSLRPTSYTTCSVYETSLVVHSLLDRTC